MENGQGFEKGLITLKPEQKFWQYVKKNFKQIRWTRLENLSAFGTPDLLGYNNNCHFFTVELKVTESKKVRLSPHQISFHVRHPLNSFILVQKLVPRDSKLNEIFLYEGKDVLELAASGLSLDACCSGLAACRLKLESLSA